MNIQETSGDQKANIRIGHSMRLTTAVAMGSIVTVGLTIYLFLGSIFEDTGGETPTAYAVTLFFFLPLVLAVAERASVTPGPGGIFNLARSSGSVPLAFTIGWLILGGLFSLAVLFAWESGVALNQLIALFFDLQIESKWLAAPFIPLALLFSRSRTMGIWKRRSTFVYFTIFLLILLILAAWFAPVEIPSTWIYIPSSEILMSVSFFAISLWSIQFVLDRRDAMPRPRRQVLIALYIPVAIGGLAGAITAATLLLYPSVTYLEPLAIVALAQQIHPLFVLLILLAMFFIGLIGITESLASSLRLSGALATDGFLPAQLQIRQHTWKQSFYMRLAFLIIPSLLLLLVPADSLVAISASAILLALILVNVQDLFHTRLNLAPNRFPKLPFHPLIPGIGAAIAITLLVLQEIDLLFGIFVWGITGALLYFAYARAGAINVRQRDAMVAGAMMPAKKTGFRVMVALSDPSTSASLLRLGNKIASAHDGLLVILRVAISTGDDELDQRLAASEWQTLNDLVNAQERIPVPATPLVRLAPDAAAGILTTIWEERIDLVLLGWPGKKSEDVSQRDGAIGQIVHKAKSEVVVLHGSWPLSVKHVLVPVISAGHSVAALTLGQDIIPQEDDGGRVVALQIVRGKLTQEKKQKAEEQLRKTRSKLDDSRGIAGEVIGSVNTKEGILQSADGYDALLLGLSDEGLLAETDFSGLPVNIALNATLPTLLVKKQEKQLRYWMRRSWDQLTAILPKLSPKRRSVVGADMRHDARADIDFYVLMVLAASIALFGLLQNSAAVIIGAMLVAPLMSPILAMSHSIVRGQVKLLRQAAESTINGVVMAIAVGTLLSLFLLSVGISIPPTSEILARTEPNFLDLLVALASGAAAAYAISRSEVSAALPGVAIAAALVPPLAVVGYGLGTAQFDLAAGSLLLFLTNLAAIILAAAVVFLLLGFRPPLRGDSDEQARFGLKMAVIALILIAIPLFATSRVSANQAARDQTISFVLDLHWPPNQAEVAEVEVSQSWKDDLSVNCTIFDYAGVVTDQSLAELQRNLSSTLGEPVILNARTINARLKSLDDSSAARQLTQTPAATESGMQGTTLPTAPTITPWPISTTTPLPGAAVVPPTSPAGPPVGTATLVLEVNITPPPFTTETATPIPSETEEPLVIPGETPSPITTAEPKRLSRPVVSREKLVRS